jgi:NAD(P)H-nitrite reductase large subunit
MRRYVLVGHSVSVVGAMTALRGFDPQAEIVIVSCDGHRPYDRMRLVELLSRKTREKDIFLDLEESSDEERFRLLLDQEIVRINFSRRKIFFSGKTQLEYDVLILADAPQLRWPDIKGLRRSGVFTLARLDQVRSLIRYLPFMETVVLQLSGTQGVSAALALQALGKEVVVLEPADRLLPSCLDQESSALLSRFLTEHSIRVITENQVVDVLGDTEVKAVRLKSGKVLACSSLVLENVAADLRFLLDTELLLAEERIPVTAGFRSNIQSVYALDAVCHMESPLVIGGYGTSRLCAQEQALTAVRNISGEDAGFACPEPFGEQVLRSFSSSDDVMVLEPVPGVSGV